MKIDGDGWKNIEIEDDWWCEDYNDSDECEDAKGLTTYVFRREHPYTEVFTIVIGRYDSFDEYSGKKVKSKYSGVEAFYQSYGGINDFIYEGNEILNIKLGEDIFGVIEHQYWKEKSLRKGHETLLKMYSKFEIRKGSNTIDDGRMYTN